MIIEILILFVTFRFEHLLVPKSRHFPSYQYNGIEFDGAGVTSLLSDTDKIVVGTKVGILHLVDPKSWKVLQVVDDGRRGFPLFSLTQSSDHQCWFVGGGDRYVNIYNDNWKLTQRLGPHTGWVKSVRYNNSILYTIGCNRVVQWKYDKEWYHSKTTAIDSSVCACTSSSDLLCLELDGSVVYAGGVDGRIHVFADDMRTKQSVLAHDGRVNQLALLKENILISGSHDGTIKCWNSEDFSLLGSYNVGTNDERVTALNCCEYDSDSFQITVGTHCGRVYRINTEVKSGTVGIIGGEMIQIGDCTSTGPVINDLCKVPGALLVGHSQGLGFIDEAI